MADHTPEPWHVSPTNPYYIMARGRGLLGSVYNRAGQATGTGVACEETMANARRICACVNACRGIPTETLEACYGVMVIYEDTETEVAVVAKEVPSAQRLLESVRAIGCNAIELDTSLRQLPTEQALELFAYLAMAKRILRHIVDGKAPLGTPEQK